jgi:hypothetical protein
MALPLNRECKEPHVAPAPPPPAAGELIEPGRALALADFDPPETTAGERLMRLAYRLGISAPTLATPFRKPAKPRLLATAESRLAGDRVAGMALRAGHFLVHGVKAPIAQLDFSSAAKLTPPFERTVHGFTCCATSRLGPARAVHRHRRARARRVARGQP